MNPKNLFFSNLTPLETQIIQTLLKEKSLNSGEFLIHEGEVGNEVYLIETGQVEILKKDIDGQLHRINRLNPGDCVGEFVLFDKFPRSASVRAIQATTVLFLNVVALKKNHPEIAKKISMNFTTPFTSRLEEANEFSIVTLRKADAKTKKLNNISRLTLQIFSVLVCYQFIMTVVIHFTGLMKLHALMLAEFPVMILICLFALHLIKKEGEPLYFYGLTLRHWKGSLVESLIVTIPLMAGVLLIKWICIKVNPGFFQDTLFDFTVKSESAANWAAVLYAFSAPLQEFLVRGVLQTSLQRALSEKHRVFFSILVSNLIFAALHQPLYWIFPVSAFIPGVLWGILFFRKRTLVGVSVSHLILGLWTFYFVGFQSY